MPWTCVLPDWTCSLSEAPPGKWARSCARPATGPSAVRSAVDRLQLEVVLDAEASPLAPDARALEAAMRGRSLDRGPVDDDASRPDSRSHRPSAVRARGPHGTGQAVIGIVSQI